MKKRFIRLAVIVLALALVMPACSVVSKDIRRQADRDIGFESLKRDAGSYEGELVIVGGYILETRNLEGKTRLLMLQAPLSIRDEPKTSDLSRGRFIVVYDGFLDPAIYEKGRKVTVAGKVLGRESEKINGHTFSMPVISSLEIYLWQKLKGPRGYYYYDPFYPWPDLHFRYRYGIHRW